MHPSPPSNRSAFPALVPTTQPNTARPARPLPPAAAAPHRHTCSVVPVTDGPPSHVAAPPLPALHSPRAQQQRDLAECVDVALRRALHHAWPERCRVAAASMQDLHLGFPRLLPVLRQLHTLLTGAAAEMERLAEAALDAAAAATSAAELRSRTDTHDAVQRERAQRTVAEKQVAALREHVRQLKAERDTDLQDAKQLVVQRLQQHDAQGAELSKAQTLLTAALRQREEMRLKLEALQSHVREARASQAGSLLRQQIQTQEEVLVEEAPRGLPRRPDIPTEGTGALHRKIRALQEGTLGLQEKLERANQELADVVREAHEDRFGHRTIQPELLAALRHDVAHGNDERLLAKFSKPTDVAPADPTLPTAGEERMARCYTPRPQVPLEVSTVLGIATNVRTSVVVAAVCHSAVGTHRANEALHESYRLSQRRLAFMDGDPFVAAVERSDAQREERERRLRSGEAPADDEAEPEEYDAPFLRTLPESEWSLAPHFLRTHVHPRVLNQHWDRRTTSRLALEMLRGFHRFSAAAAATLQRDGTRDPFMIAQVVAPAMDRRFEPPLSPHDPKGGDTKSILHVPAGYAASAFLREKLHEVQQSPELAALLGAIAGDADVQRATLGYNLWAGLQRHRAVEPVCDLLLGVLDGTLPVGLFQRGQDIIQELRSAVSRRLTDPQADVLSYRAVAETLVDHLGPAYPGTVWRSALWAVSRSTRAHGSPFSDGFRLAHLFADESDPVPSALVHYMRHLVVSEHRSCVEVLVQRLLPIAQTSAAVPTMSVVPLEEAVAVARELDADRRGARGLEWRHVGVEVSLALTVQRAGAGLPKYNASVHLAKESPTDPEKGPRRSSRRRSTRRRSTAHPGPPVLLTENAGAQSAKAKFVHVLRGVLDDQSLVEWHALRLALQEAELERAHREPPSPRTV